MHLLDMATINFTFQPAKNVAQAHTADGHLLSAIHTSPELTEADHICQLLDNILETGAVLDIDPTDPTQRIARKVALYNPFTHDIAVNALPLTERLALPGPIPLPKEGLAADLHPTPATTLTIHTPNGTQTATAATRTVNELTRVIATHP